MIDTMDINALEKGFFKLKSVTECKNLMSLHCYNHTTMQHRDCTNLWSKREDSILEMPWGIYDGYSSIERCYLKDLGDRYDCVNAQKLKGRFCVNTVDTPLTRVAEDGKTVRGCWLGPGLETYTQNGQSTCNWVWSKYGVDFIYENDNWHIWKMKIYPLINAPYDVCWTDLPSNSQKIDNSSCDRPLDHNRKLYSYGPNEIYPVDQPNPPSEYSSYEQVGYTW